MAGTLTASLFERLVRCRGGTLPDAALLPAKLLALGWLVTGHALYVPGVFLPFVPWLDAVPSWPLQAALLAAGIAACIAILFDVTARRACFVLAGTILVSTLASRAYFSNNRLFTAAILVVLGLSEDDRRARVLVSLQMALLYFGAGLDKLLDADWRSGAFLSSLLDTLARAGTLWSPGGAGEPNGLAHLVVAVLPQVGPLDTIASVTVIALELGLAVAFLSRRWRLAAAGSLLFQTALVALTGSTMGMFFYATLFPLAAFRPSHATARLDLSKHRFLAFALRALDADERVTHLPTPGGKARGVANALASLPAMWLAVGLVLSLPLFRPLPVAVAAALLSAVALLTRPPHPAPT